MSLSLSVSLFVSPKYERFWLRVKTSRGRQPRATQLAPPAVERRSMFLFSRPLSAVPNQCAGFLPGPTQTGGGARSGAMDGGLVLVGASGLKRIQLGHAGGRTLRAKFSFS